MGYRHSSEEILAGALDAALENGLSQLTFGRLAARLGIADRTIVYYFPTKRDLIRAVFELIGADLMEALSVVLTRKAEDHLDLVSMAWPVLTRPSQHRIFALFFEANGLAAVGRSPYGEIVPPLVQEWADWIASHIAGPPEVRNAEAAAAVALIDGLLLLRLLNGASAADQAARTVGVVE